MASTAKPYPTQAEVRQLFDYDNGYLYWKVRAGRNVKPGQRVGPLASNHYVHVTIKGLKYKAHRIIWIWHNGPIKPHIQIDHINGIKDDNRIENLRPVTLQENAFNIKSVKGYYKTASGKWVATIFYNGKSHHIGTYKTEALAKAARERKKNELHRIKQR